MKSSGYPLSFLNGVPPHQQSFFFLKKNRIYGIYHPIKPALGLISHCSVLKGVIIFSKLSIYLLTFLSVSSIHPFIYLFSAVIQSKSVP